MKNNKNKGILFIVLAAFGFSLMTVFVRLSGDLPVMQKALFRNLVAAGVSWALVLRSRKEMHLRKEDIPDHMMRTVFGTAGMALNFYAVGILNISDANLLNKLSPFFAMFMSIFVLNEKPSKKEWMILLLAFCGALFVIKPGLNMEIFPAICGAFSGFCAGVAYTYVRKLGKKGVKGPVIVCFFSTCSTLICLPFFIVQYKPMTMGQFLCLMGAGLGATLGQLAITKAYTYAPAKEISVYDYTQVLFAALWGFFLFGQIPDIYSIIGYGIIIGAAVWRAQTAG